MKVFSMVAWVALVVVVFTMTIYSKIHDPTSRFLEDAFIPQPWRYNVPDGEIRRSLIVSYVGPEGVVVGSSGMHEIRSAMRAFPRAFCAGSFQPGLIRQLNGPTGDLEIVCVYNWDIKTGEGSD